MKILCRTPLYYRPSPLPDLIASSVHKCTRLIKPDKFWEWDKILEWDKIWEWDRVWEWDKVLEWDHIIPLD